MEKIIKLCEDVNCKENFYNYVNYNWIKDTKIPDGYSKWSIFQIIQDNNLNKIKEILEQAKTSSNLNYNKLYIIYSQYFNYKKREEPYNILYIQKIFDRINSCSTSLELFNLMYNYDLLLNLSIPINTYIQTNFRNANEVILHVGSGGLGLPDRDYYLIDSKIEIINKYKEFIQNYSKLFYFPIDSKIIFNIEKKLAEKTYTKVQKRIPELNDNLINWKIFTEKFPNLKFIKKIFEIAKKEPEKINVTNLGYLEFLNEFISSIELFNWKQYFCFKIMLIFHNCLNFEIEKIYFDFYEGVLSGVKKMKEDWIRSIEFTESLLGQLLGQLYVEKYFNHQSKIKVLEMINFIKDELQNILNNNDWMSSETKKKAILKLNKINVKVGYPDKYDINYDLVEVSDDNSLLINYINLRSFEINHRIKKLYEPLDRNQWFMNCHNVNAYYSPSFNEIVFPAGILQAPFFSLDQNISFNFGGIGSIIGHEITHGFDDQGSKFDSDGNLNNWWTEEDLIKYKAKTENVKKQYSDYKILGKKINTELTLGENIADIGGVYISFNAFEKYLLQHPEENINLNNFTPQQLFFINYANIWKSKSTDEEVHRRLLVDPHSPPELRVNYVLRNINAFYSAFGVKKENSLYLEPEKRVRIFSN